MRLRSFSDVTTNWLPIQSSGGFAPLIPARVCLLRSLIDMVARIAAFASLFLCAGLVAAQTTAPSTSPTTAPSTQPMSAMASLATKFPTPAELYEKIKKQDEENDKLLKVAYFDISDPITE